MSTPVLSPADLPFPITIDQLITPIGSHVEKGQRLFAYKFWYMVEIAQSPDNNDPTSENSSDLSGNNSDSNENGNNASHQKKSIRESIEFFESPFEGDLIGWNVDKGDEIISENQLLCDIKRPCNHDIVYAGICTQCGKEVDDSDIMDASLSISHTDTNLKISRKEARDIDQSSMSRLKKIKKLILVVDLDQTVIHCGVDPTIGEWKNDPKNPNYETLKDVRSFSLDEEPILPPSYMGPRPPVRKCWYYVKVRPGLKEFFAKIAPLYEMHIYTMATRAYALEIAKIIDPDGSLFGSRILSRDENGSLTQKSLERLFPTDQSMVIIIDDRGDVWNWCNNLIKVIPYNFFVGIGDINSNFLPRQQSTMLQLGIRSHKKKNTNETLNSEDDKSDSTLSVHEKDKTEELLTDIMDTEKKLQKKIDEEVRRQEKKLIKDEMPKRKSISDESSNNELSKKIEFSASLEVQQQNRPLATLQRHRQNQRLLIDDDDELFYLKDILTEVHDTFYEQLDEDKNESVSIQTLMPRLKFSVFSGYNFVFSGLIPLGTDIRRADIVLWTNMFGANSTADIDENTTHVITKTAGTYKARLAKAFNPEIKVVHPDWIFECLVSWKRMPEKPYELIIEQPASEEELEEFKKKLELKNELLEKREMETEAQFEALNTRDPAIDLFASGTSWLNDDDDDIPISDSDSSIESDTEKNEEDYEPNLSDGKRSFKEESTDQMRNNKKLKILDESESEVKKNEEQEDTDLEEELLNALDDFDDDDEGDKNN
ncbi:hypothetical protein TBLA_0D03260 [Henningerozyma blattae CBS 6284]|uniref:RNA polymerase II subunit A C-terminal domain phosphatase n=1 Tax=Henningerozyma blattae (strain ATCC 34711 / CBS 6284 / DSM 70876 / NBRC 10599 / NRRL Y-10934 / UCD 77-7) TaxID=1071380 RepID=I2H374_HENB6|nr:hypothetical protein TBLA_0D03260 [Tetrapisispora blattae CBS 6284]CCH60826.1 hypothetical protein TBLA_0D03260 [Tetrapisispora blattae CBS 6284]